MIDDVGDDSDVENLAISTEILSTTTDWREALLGSYLVAATTSMNGVATPEVPTP